MPGFCLVQFLQLQPRERKEFIRITQQVPGSAKLEARSSDSSLAPVPCTHTDPSLWTLGYDHSKSKYTTSSPTAKGAPRGGSVSCLPSHQSPLWAPQHSPFGTRVLAMGHSHLSQVIEHHPLQRSLLALIAEASNVDTCREEVALRLEGDDRGPDGGFILRGNHRP